MKKKSAHILSRYLSGFSLLELLIVIALIAVVASQVLHTWWTFSANQALAISADNFASSIKIAHIYAREAKDNNAWGIIRSSNNSYKLVAGLVNNPTVISSQTLESRIKFKSSDFSIWFDKGTGETSTENSIELTNSNGKTIKVKVIKTGLVEISGIN